MDHENPGRDPAWKLQKYLKNATTWLSEKWWGINPIGPMESVNKIHLKEIQVADEPTTRGCVRHPWRPPGPWRVLTSLAAMDSSKAPGWWQPTVPKGWSSPKKTRRWFLQVGHNKKKQLSCYICYIWGEINSHKNRDLIIPVNNLSIDFWPFIGVTYHIYDDRGPGPPSRDRSKIEAQILNVWYIWLYMNGSLVGGFHPSEKYSSNWKSSPTRGKNRKSFETTT